MVAEAAEIEVRMDLKICERCGALWCRVVDTAGRHCRGCVGTMAERPAAVVLKAGRPRGEFGAAIIKKAEGAK